MLILLKQSIVYAEDLSPKGVYGIYGDINTGDVVEVGMSPTCYPSALSAAAMLDAAMNGTYAPFAGVTLMYVPRNGADLPIVGMMSCVPPNRMADMIVDFLHLSVELNRPGGDAMTADAAQEFLVSRGYLSASAAEICRGERYTAMAVATRMNLEAQHGFSETPIVFKNGVKTGTSLPFQLLTN